MADKWSIGSYSRRWPNPRRAPLGAAFSIPIFHKDIHFLLYTQFLIYEGGKAKRKAQSSLFEPGVNTTLLQSDLTSHLLKQRCEATCPSGGKEYQPKRESMSLETSFITYYIEYSPLALLFQLLSSILVSVCCFTIHPPLILPWKKHGYGCHWYPNIGINLHLQLGLSNCTLRPLA